MDLNGKIVLLIGGRGLIGQTLTARIVAEGGTVIVTSRSDGADVDISSPNIHVKTLDITDETSLEKALSSTAKEFGRIDAVVNGAWPRNTNFGAKFEDVAITDFNENMVLHLGGAFLVAQKAAAFFVKQGHGNLINFSSIYGVVPPRFEIYEGTEMTKEIEYSLAKAGIVMLTQYLAKYFKGKNIRFNCVSPGGVLDGQPEPFLSAYRDHCLNKGMLDAEDVVGAIIFLISDDSKFVNGQNLIVDDGFTL